MKTLLGSIVAVVMTGLTTSAVYAEPANTTVVSYGDLNIDTPAGLKTLNARIHSAANRLCDTSSFGDLARRTETQKCYHSAVADAMKQLSDRKVQVASR